MAFDAAARCEHTLRYIYLHRFLHLILKSKSKFESWRDDELTIDENQLAHLRVQRRVLNQVNDSLCVPTTFGTTVAVSFPHTQHHESPLLSNMGGGGGGNVDDIWAQLKAKTAPSQHAQKAKQLLRGAQGIVSVDSRSTSKSKEKQQYDLPVAPHAGRNKNTSDADPAAVPSGAVVPAAAAAAAATPVFADYDALQTGVARDLNTLADAQGSSSNRLKALQRISGVIDTIPVEMVG